jgi:hypothetical protein
MSSKDWSENELAGEEKGMKKVSKAAIITRDTGLPDPTAASREHYHIPE